MDKIMEVLKWILENWSALITSLIGLLMAVYGVLLIIPGNQGEAVIQKIADFLKKITFNNPS